MQCITGTGLDFLNFAVIASGFSSSDESWLVFFAKSQAHRVSSSEFHDCEC